MINTLVGDINTGRLLRLQYIGYSLVLLLMVMGFVFFTILAIGAGEHLFNGNLQEAQAQLQDWFSLPFILAFGVFMIVLLFSSMNIMAKRIRDIGLPGWITVFGVMILEGIVSVVISEESGSSLHTVVWLLLVLVPSNTLGKE